MAKFFLIDTPSHTIREIEIATPGPLQPYYDAIGCELVEAVYPHGMPQGDCLYVDEEGLLKPEDVLNERGFFIWSGYPQPLAGRGLVVGTNDEGNTVAPKLTLSDVQARVGWVDSVRRSHLAKRAAVIFS